MSRCRKELQWLNVLVSTSVWYVALAFGDRGVDVTFHMWPIVDASQRVMHLLLSWMSCHSRWCARFKTRAQSEVDATTWMDLSTMDFWPRRPRWSMWSFDPPWSMVRMLRCSTLRVLVCLLVFQILEVSRLVPSLAHLAEWCCHC